MTPEITGFLVLFVAAILLFSFEWFSADVVALGLMLCLIITGLLPAKDAFLGFGSETVLMILGLLIMTEALMHTGIVDIVGRQILRRVGKRPTTLQVVMMLAPSLMSAFVSNAATAAFFMPITLGVARRARISVARLLMPMSFAVILAGSLTLIGTSTNIVVSGLMEQYGLKPMGMFELTAVALPIWIIGLLYMYFIGLRLIPDRTGEPQTESSNGTPYFTEIIIPEGSPEIGKTIGDSVVVKGLNLGVIQMHRQKEELKPLVDTQLQGMDTLVVEGSKADILAINETPGIDIRGAVKTLNLYARGEQSQIAEVVLLPGSPLIGRNIRGLGLRERFKLQILAINQHGKISYNRLGRHIFELGDVLLIQLPRENIPYVEEERFFRILDILEEAPAKLDRQPLIATGIFLFSLLLAIFEVLAPGTAFLLGALMMFLTKCITPEEAYRNVDWKTIMLIGSMLAFGQAMLQTGTADYLAQQIGTVAGSMHPVLLMGLFFILAVVLTQPMSNQTAAAILVPIAIQTAIRLDYDPRPFALMIALAASCSFVTPLEPACVIVYSAGKYKFMDFIRVGGVLTVIEFLVALLFAALVWKV